MGLEDHPVEHGQFANDGITELLAGRNFWSAPRVVWLTSAPGVLVFTTLFGLLASTGLRLSEALDLRFGDVTDDGLIIRKTKFNKTRAWCRRTRRSPPHSTAISTSAAVGPP